MAFDNGRARAELGFAPRPAAEALEDSARWFTSTGRVGDRRLSRIRWASDR
jgi:nucleoside-diphosphate-sugar epimerase